ncbi:MAG: thiamine diphosphokinase [Weeksellaceae bacterium]
MNRVALFLNGLPPKKIPNLSQFNQIYCTDGAYHYLIEKRIKPDVVCGDFDSFPKEDIPEGIEIIELADQNYTDFEKTLRLLKEREFEEVYIYGSSGMEHDHFLGNLSSALKFKEKMTLLFFDDYSYYFFADKETQMQGYKDRVISLYPFPSAKNVETEGLKFPLTKEDLDLTNRIGIRNIATKDEVIIRFEEGNLLLFIKNGD